MGVRRWLLFVGSLGISLGIPWASASATDGRVSATQKGSLLIFPDVEIKWAFNTVTQTFDVVQDTFLTMTNDFPDDVTLLLYYINGDPATFPIVAGEPPEVIERGHPGWNHVDCEFVLTRNQPTYWSAATGLPAGCQPFSVLDPGPPPGTSPAGFRCEHTATTRGVRRTVVEGGPVGRVVSCEWH